MAIDRFVRITLELPEGAKGRDKWQPARKLRFNHRDLRDVCKESGQSIGQLFSDPFGGWPYLMQFALRWQDLSITLDRCSELIDGWRDSHQDDLYPLNSLGEKLLEAINASGYVRIEAENPLPKEDEAKDGELGNE